MFQKLIKKPLLLSVVGVAGLCVATLWPHYHQAFCSGATVI